MEDESACEDCGRHNPVWFAPNALWNLVIGGPEAKGDPGGFYCPNCFIARAEKAGIRPAAWKLHREHESDAWMSIETAPRDGTRFFAWWPHMGKPVLAWFAVNGIGAGGWRFLSSQGGNIAKPAMGPTHWRATPPPPPAASPR